MTGRIVDDGESTAFEARRELESALARESFLKSIAFGGILGESAAMSGIRAKIEKIASCDVCALILGESGTGKELAARAVHYLSKRNRGPFIPVNCGAIPEEIFENELFGHVAGAFTGARKHAGLVREAGGGTLFLDEIGTISLHAQAKLLRLIQDKEFKPLGEGRPRKADIRILAATNSDLAALVKKNAFREDLYYRLSVVPLTMPPLRERREDIPVLAEEFIRKYSIRYEKPAPSISREAMEKLSAYPWPGNVRELENVIQHIVIMSSGAPVTGEDVPLGAPRAGFHGHGSELFSVAKKNAVDSFEKAYLINLLKEHEGNVASAARKAGKSRTALWNLLRKHNISPKALV